MFDIFFSSAKLALYSFNKRRRKHASAPSCVAPMQAANWVAVKTTGTLKPPLQMCTLDHFALLHRCKRSETLAPFHLFILCWTLTMTTRLLQNVVKLLQSKIGAKLLQEGAYWRGGAHRAQKWGCIAHKCTQLHTGTKLHRSTKQKCTTRPVHRHQFNLMPPPCPQRKSGIRKKTWELGFFHKTFDYKGLFSPTNQSSEVLASGDGGAGKVAINAHKEMEGALAVLETDQWWFQVWVACVCH